jgi:Putative zinc-finger
MKYKLFPSVLETVGVDQIFVKFLLKSMNCEALQYNLSLYIDEELSLNEKSELDNHLKVCPSCRLKLDDFRDLQHSFRSFSSLRIRNEFESSLKVAVLGELQKSKLEVRTSASFFDFLRMRLMPYGVGVVVSCFLFTVFLNSLLSTKSGFEVAKNSIKQESEIAFLPVPDRPINLPIESDQFEVISASLLASQRTSVSKESPSINPAGALVALANTLVREDVKEDEIVLVAEVFGDGIARISRFIESPKDQNTIKKLEDALQNDPNFAPFVPSSLDNRSDSVQIVLLLNQVDVFESSPPTKTKKRTP